jgi:hypothetical protein
MLSDWVSFLAYPNLFGIKGFVVVVLIPKLEWIEMACFNNLPLLPYAYHMVFQPPQFLD